MMIRGIRCWLSCPSIWVVFLARFVLGWMQMTPWLMLDSMIVGGVKKVGCGHVCHTNCPCEVVEQSIATVNCTLYRALPVSGRQNPHVVPQMTRGS